MFTLAWVSGYIPIWYVGVTGNAGGVKREKDALDSVEEEEEDNIRGCLSDAELKRKPWMLDAVMMLSWEEKGTLYSVNAEEDALTMLRRKREPRMLWLQKRMPWQC
jgi:hypothetical protein